MESSGAGPERRCIVLVCYGNICRSPTAEAVLRARLRAAGLERRFSVGSAGVAAVVGARAASGAQSVAQAHGLDLSAHRARQLTAAQAREADVLVALDEVVEAEIDILAGDVGVQLWPVDDPYGGPPEGYERAFAAIERHVARFIAALGDGACA